jgi:putative ABC transport system permease protein
MTRVAVKGLLGRKARAILTSLAIVLGVAMVSGTFVLTDTIKKAFDGVFDSAYSQTDVVVSGKEIVKTSTSRPTVSQSLVARVRALPGVAAAAGNVTGSVKLVDEDGHKIGAKNAESIGFGVDPRQPRFAPVKLTAGTWASGPGEIVIDRHTAQEHHYAIGDTIRAQADGPARRFRITGIGRLGGTDIGGLSLAVFDVPTAQAVVGRPGRLDEIDVAAKPGVSQGKLAHAIAPVLPATAQVKTADKQAKEQADEVGSAIRIVRTFLLVFGGIALFVGSFVIFNTISITIAQRTRELATLRTIGASRRQVLRSVMVETLVIGAIASAIGLFLGLGIAKGLEELFKAVGADLPKASMVLSARTVIVSFAVGTVVTAVAGLGPALRATRVAPIAAVREGAPLPHTRFARMRPYLAGVLGVLGVAAIANGVFGGGTATEVLVKMGAGTVLVFVAVAMTARALVRPLAAFVGRPARSMGGAAGRLAAENAVRNPGRTAATAAALMIGLAFVAFVATLGSGLRNGLTASLHDQLRGDYVVSAASDSDNAVLTPAAGRDIARTPGVVAASSVRSDMARVYGKDTPVVGVDPATLPRVYGFDMTAGGSDAAVRRLAVGQGALVAKTFASKHGLHAGSPVRIQSADGRKATVTVRGIYKEGVEQLLDGVVIPRATFDRTFPQPRDSYTFVRAAPGATTSLRRAVARYPDARLETTDAFITRDQKDVDTTLMMFYVLLALSVVVSLFGMVNTMVLSVFERTRELGMLRALGMTRRQARRMVRQETVITALIGAALGLPVGVFLAGIVTKGLSGYGVGFHLPVGSLVAFAIVAAAAGVLAAIQPARRAARLDVLTALQYE